MRSLSRRGLVKGGLAVGAAVIVSNRLFAQERANEALASITGAVNPIGRTERESRLARAQSAMQQAGIGALVVEPGASLIYYTGVRWRRSERLTVAVIPAEGHPIIVTPFFEKPSVEETLGIEAETRVWQEDESPYSVIAEFLKSKGLSRAKLGVEETVRYFVVDGLAKALPLAKIERDTITRNLRMRKTNAEIALMQKAADVTMEAYRWTYPRVKAGMAPADIAALMNAATTALGGKIGFNLILLGEAAAYPHGTGKPQSVTRGEIVLMDCGCSVADYESDISRTFVHAAEPNAEQKRVWAAVSRGQQIAFEAARLGVPAGRVDDAVRQYYGSLGFGPNYNLPGLSHRTGHGIGMEGHEPVNLVRGESTPLEVGMCFSNEPGLYLPGQFGIRMEDCFFMTDNGPKWFSQPPISIEDPIR